MIKVIVILGDIHFRDDYPYFMETCEKFLEWYKDWELNNSNNDLILAGDLVETSLLSGRVADYLERFYTYSKFKGIHIVVGNHDKKLTKGRQQIAYEFYRQKDNVFIYDSIKEVELQGYSGLLLPYFTDTNDVGYTMSEYYSTLYANSKYNGIYDFIVGHFADESCPYEDYIKNTDKLNGRLILGHIHTRASNPNVYIGSVFANKKGENDNTRCAFVLNDDGWSEYKLPIFNEFIEVNYGDKLPKSKALVPVYTILGCGSEQIAREKYGNIFIRKAILTDDKVSKNKSDIERKFSSIKDLDIKILYNSFMEEVKNKYTKDVLQSCKDVLEIKN